MANNLSTKPLYRAIQLKALRDGCPVYKLKEIEQRIHVAIFGLSQSMQAPGVHKFNVRGGGVAAAIELGEWAGQKWHTSIGAAGIDGKFIGLFTLYFFSPDIFWPFLLSLHLWIL